MNEHTCETVRPLLPEWVEDTLDGVLSAQVSRHVASCEACLDEADLLRALRRARPEPPSDLAGRIQAALAAQREVDGPRGAPSVRRGGAGRWWPPAHPRFAVAAVVVLALGTAVIWRQMPDGTLHGFPETVGTDAFFASPWLGDAGIIAGAPVLEELSDEQLLTLLEELGG